MPTFATNTTIIMRQYIGLIEKIRKYGRQKGDRTGTGTISIFGHDMRFKMSDGFPLLMLKKTHFKSVVHELIWFLKGSTNIKYLTDNGVTIWNEWADENGELGPVYGKQWRKWEKYGYRGIQNGALDCGLISQEEADKEMHIDQIADVINQLKNNPDSRRIMVSAWNVSDVPKMKLPPCHYGFQFYTHELTRAERIDWLFAHCYETGMERAIVESQWKDEDMDDTYFGVPRRALSLKWTQRSVDTFLGLPFNIASYGLLLHMVAQCVNMVPHELIGSLGDTHLYLNHSEQVNELLKRWENVKSNEPKLPVLILNPEIKDIFSFKYEDINLDGYNPMPSIKAPVAV